MATKTEGVHAEEFILSEANGKLSREQVTVKAGANLKAGQVVRDDTGMVAFTADSHTAVGVLTHDVDATDGAKQGVVIERIAEVKGGALNWSTSNEAAITKGTADLLARNIKIRN